MGLQSFFAPIILGVFTECHLGQRSHKNTEMTIMHAISWDMKKEKRNFINIYPISNNKNICILWSETLMTNLFSVCLAL